MNQTKKRLEIIRLAISITDIETIQLQMLKLGLLKTDAKVQEIIDALQAKNYAHAQSLITTYIQTPKEEISQRVAPQERQKSEKDIIDEFDLLVSEPQKKEAKREIDFDALLNMTAEDVLVDQLKPDTSTASKETQKEKTEERHIASSHLNSDKEVSSKVNYKAISYIDQKFKNMCNRYPPTEPTTEHFPSVEAWLLKISKEGYSDEEVEEIIDHITKLTQSDKKAEAAQLLLISGATEAPFAQFILARELYRGEILQKNLSEAFTLINRLAINDYPEAICDLGQFYEHGIGVHTDIKKAKLLYKEAMESGIKRAQRHYERVNRKNSNIFSFFKKSV